MSYSVLLFNPAMKTLASNRYELDAVKPPALEPQAVTVFLQRLERYGYSFTGRSPAGEEFTKPVRGATVVVLVGSSEISFSASSEPAIFEALQDASELTDRGDLALFNPQEGSWLEA